MKRLAWHIESFAWWLLLTGLLAVYCIAVTVGMVAVACRRAG